MTAYSAEVLADSPVAYWRLGEASGTTAADEVGTNDGTYDGSPTLGVSGLVGGSDTAVTLDGATTSVSVAGPNLTGAVTAEMWIQVNDTAQSDQLIFGFYDNSSGYPGWGIIYNLRGSRRIGYWAGTGTWVESTGTINDSATHHVVVTVSAAGSVTFYIDGAAAGTASYATPGSYAGTKRLGARSSGALNFLDATVDEAALYDTALTSTRIQAHYDAGTSSGITGTATSTPAALAAPTQSATGSFDPGTFTGTVTSTATALAAPSQDGSGTHTPPAFSGTATSAPTALATPTQSASGTFDPGTFTGTAASAPTALAAPTQSASGTHTAPVFTGTATSTPAVLAAPTQTAAGTHTPPVYTGTVTSTAASLAAPSQTAAGIVVNPTFTGTVAQAVAALSAPAVTLAGTFTPRPYADPTPPERTHIVTADNRTYIIAAEPRTTVIPPERRTLEVTR